MAGCHPSRSLLIERLCNLVLLPSILSTKFEQPTFGANYFTFDIKPMPDGGLTSGTTAEVRFKDQAMFQFVAILEKTRERAIYMKRQEVENEEGLRAFTCIYGIL